MYSRRYKSKSQRPCDFCRRRRSACRIISAPPCELCKAHGRECTFADAPPPRKPRTDAAPAAAREMDGGDPGLHVGSTPELGAGVVDMLDDAWAADYLSHSMVNGTGSTPDSTLMASYLTGHDVENSPLRLEEHAVDRNIIADSQMQPSNGRQRELISRSNSVLGATDPCRRGPHILVQPSLT